APRRGCFVSSAGMARTNRAVNADLHGSNIQLFADFLADLDHGLIAIALPLTSSNVDGELNSRQCGWHGTPLATALAWRWRRWFTLISRCTITHSRFVFAISRVGKRLGLIEQFPLAGMDSLRRPNMRCRAKRNSSIKRRISSATPVATRRSTSAVVRP